MTNAPTGLRSYSFPDIQTPDTSRLLSQENKELIISRLRKNGLLLKTLPSYLRRDLRCVMAAVEQNPAAVLHADPVFRTSDLHMLALWLTNKKSLAYFPRNQAFITLTQRHPEILKELKTEEIKKLWWVSPISILSHPDLMELIPEAKQLSQKLKSLNISELDRLRFLNLADLKQLIANHEPAPWDKRPVALMVYPKYDNQDKPKEGKAFIKNDIKELLSGYRLIYCETDSDEHFLQTVKKYGSLKKIQLLIIGGHGTPTSLLFATPRENSRIANNQHLGKLDVTDRQKLLDMKFKEYLMPNVTISLESCSTAAGGRGALNLANMLHGVVPNATIFAPVKDSYTPDYVLNAQKRVLRIVHYSDYQQQVTLKIDGIAPASRVWKPAPKPKIPLPKKKTSPKIYARI